MGGVRSSLQSRSLATSLDSPSCFPLMPFSRVAAPPSTQLVFTLCVWTQTQPAAAQLTSLSVPAHSRSITYLDGKHAFTAANQSESSGQYPFHLLQKAAMTLWWRMAGFPCKRGSSPISPFSNWRVLTKHSSICLCCFLSCPHPWNGKQMSEEVRSSLWLTLVLFTSLKGSYFAASCFYGHTGYLGQRLAGLLETACPQGCYIGHSASLFHADVKEGLNAVAFGMEVCLLSVLLYIQQWKTNGLLYVALCMATHGKHVGVLTNLIEGREAQWRYQIVVFNKVKDLLLLFFSSSLCSTRSQPASQLM